MHTKSSPEKPLARSIVEHALALDAGRIAFPMGDGFVFAEPSLEAVASVLEEHKPLKYKLQRRDAERRWVNLTKYVPARSISKLLEAMQRADLKSARQASPQELAAAAGDDPGGFRLAIRRVAAAVTVHPKSSEISAWRTFLETYAADIRDERVEYLLATLECLDVALQHGLVYPLDPAALSEPLEALRACENRFISPSSRVAYDIVCGKIMSLIDREAACIHFERARERDSSGLLENFYVDVGARTYFVEGELEARGLDARVTQVQRSLMEQQTHPSAHSFAVVVSADENFFRIYGTQLIALAQQMPDVDFVVILCAGEREAASLVELADVFGKQLAHFNRSGGVLNIQYYSMPVPDFVQQPVTFYASARFFAASPLLERYERLYIMDIDLSANDDPTAYFERIKAVTFGTPSNNSLISISPWRRYLAGNVSIGRGAESSGLLRDLQSYLVCGLMENSSWMLDQNALTFAIERHPQIFESLDPYYRPFGQLRFRSTWEQRYWKAMKG